jgi:hypothetical protein
MPWTVLPLALLASPALSSAPDLSSRDAPPRPRVAAAGPLRKISGPLYRQLSLPERRRDARPQLVLELEDATAAVDLGALPGVTVELRVEGLVQLRADWAQLEALAAQPGVQRVREPRRPRPKEVVSEGLDDLYGPGWQDHGLTGAGVTIAVLDVGFAGYAELLGSELPDSVGTHLVGDWRGSDHGTDVAQVIHDIAPDAELVLYSFDTDVEFLAAAEHIAASGAHLVNASVGFDNEWHADGTSIWSRAVDMVHDRGIAWINAAGNENDCYWVGTMTDEDGDGWLELDGDELFLVESDWTTAAEVDVSFRWDDPFGASANDLDLFIDWIDWEVGDEPCDAGEDPQDGDDDPYERAWCDLGGGAEYAYASVYVYEGTGAGKTGWLYSYHSLPEENRSNRQSLTLPADARGGIAVAAVDWEHDELVYYSSRGPTDDGRDKPDVAAPTFVSTTNGRFTGTSAAAPHATGAAALALEASLLSLDPDAIRDWLASQTIDLGPPGYDHGFGWGYLRLVDPPGEPTDTGDPGGEDSEVLDTGTGEPTDTDEPVEQPPPTEPEESRCGCASRVSSWSLAWLLAALGGLTLRRRR